MQISAFEFLLKSKLLFKTKPEIKSTEAKKRFQWYFVLKYTSRVKYA